MTHPQGIVATRTSGDRWGEKQWGQFVWGGVAVTGEQHVHRGILIVDPPKRRRRRGMVR